MTSQPVEGQGAWKDVVRWAPTDRDASCDTEQDGSKARRRPTKWARPPPTPPSRSASRPPAKWCVLATTLSRYIYIITAKAYDEATAGQHDAREEHTLTRDTQQPQHTRTTHAHTHSLTTTSTSRGKGGLQPREDQMVHPTHSRTNSSVPTLPALIPIPTPSAHPPIHPPRTATPPAAQIHKGRLACVFRSAMAPQQPHNYIDRSGLRNG